LYERVDQRIEMMFANGFFLTEHDLRGQVTRLEAEHPRLAAVIGRAADALSALGL
jgi:hypothetical protein